MSSMTTETPTRKRLWSRKSEDLFIRMEPELYEIVEQVALERRSNMSDAARFLMYLGAQKRDPVPFEEQPRTS